MHKVISLVVSACLLIFVLSFRSERVAAESGVQKEPLDKLIEALIQVESGGDNNAVGDCNLSSKAYGCLQIRQPCVDDFNKWNGTSHRAKDCLGNRPLSTTICKWYLGYYANEKRLGRMPTDEDRARIWNGGPNGWKKLVTTNYWTKVKVALDQESGLVANKEWYCVEPPKRTGNTPTPRWFFLIPFSLVFRPIFW